MPTERTLATKDPAVLLNRIKREFPELSWDSYKFIDAGWDHEVIQLDNNYIFRFPNSREYLSVLRDEIGLLEYLGAHTKARIPQYSFIAQDFSFAGYPMLPGTELSPEILSTLPEAQRNKAAKDIADFLTDLHSTNIDDLSKFNTETEASFGGYDDVDKLALEYLKPNLPADDYAMINDMVSDIAKVKTYPHTDRLTHWDIAPKHLIWDSDNEVVGFIDFSDRAIADPAFDFAELYTYGEAFVDKVYELYQGADKQPQFLLRAKAYMKAIGIKSLVNTYLTDKITHDEGMRLIRIGAALQIKDS